LRSAAAHAFVADLAAPELDGQDRHHFERVLRLRPGQVVTVADGTGAWRCCTWRDGGDLEPAGEMVRAPTLLPPVTVGLAVTKGERFDWAVQKLTELGVDRIVALVAARSVVRLDGEAASRRVLRWRRVAREAAVQSRRVTLPEVDGILPVTGVAAGVEGGLRPGGTALADPGGQPPSLQRPTVLVGPEGGWSPEELASGLATVGLGSTVLRAETAAVAAGVLLCSLRAGLVGER
jgi:16S rRNA (uracil1498-N3)-methyltransferase